MKYLNYQQVLQAAIKKWGKQSQIEIAIEECAELIKALQKLKRIESNTIAIRNVCEEIADVDIMISQLKLIFSQQWIEEIKIDKLNRLEKRIES